MRRGADCDQHLGGLDDLFAVPLVQPAGDGNAVGETKRPAPMGDAHAVAGELVFLHRDFMFQRLVEPRSEVGSLDVLLDPVGLAIKPRSRQPDRLSTVSRKVFEGIVPV